MPKREIRVVGDIAYVPLTRGYEAIIDADCVEKVSGFNWSVRVDKLVCYAARAEKKDGKYTAKIMHRILINAPDGFLVDHINGDGLDNRLSNLRLATRNQNTYNQRKPKTNKSGLKGVSKFKSRWVAQIAFCGEKIYLGLFNCPTAGHLAYVKAAKSLFGEFARFK